MAMLSLINFQLCPPSFDRNNPPAASWNLPWISAYTTFGLLGATAMPALPKIPVGRPWAWLMLVQVAPPSVVLKMPLPGPPLENVHGRRYACHIVAYNTRGSAGSIASVIAPVWSLTNWIFFQVLPPSVLLYTPRSAFGAHTWPMAATYTTSGSCGATTIQLITWVLSS